MTTEQKAHLLANAGKDIMSMLHAHPKVKLIGTPSENLEVQILMLICISRHLHPLFVDSP